MKKLLIAAGLMAATTLSASAAPFSGPAVGLALGVGNMGYKVNKGLFGETVFGTIGKAANTGFNGRVFGQWGTVRGSFHFGVDLGVGADTSKAKKSHSGTFRSAGFTQANFNSFVGTYKNFTAAGITINSPVTFEKTLRNNFFVAPGIRFGGVVGGKTLVFGRLGVNVQFQKLETKVTSGTQVALFKDNMMTTQVVPGVGADYMINDNLFVRGQIEYAIGVGTTGNRDTFKKKPSSFIANVGVGYQF